MQTVYKELSEWSVRLLQDESPEWPKPCDLNRIEEIEHFFEQELIGPICYYKLNEINKTSLIPTQILELLHGKYLLLAATTLQKNTQDRQIIDFLYNKGFDPIILKGAAYAVMLYPAPELRPRSDTDLLFPDHATAQNALSALHELGYRPYPNEVESNSITYQKAYYKPGALPHSLDIHWAINNTHAFVQALPYAELTENTIPLEKIHPNARTINVIYSLFFALLHFFRHERVGKITSILWSYDIFLLTKKMNDLEWQQFKDLAIEKNLAGICLYVLDKVSSTFPFTFPNSCKKELEKHQTEEIFRPDRLKSPLHFKLNDLHFLPGWKQRTKSLLKICIPPTDYMFTRYHTNSRLLLPYLYCKRLVEVILNQIK